MKQKDIIIIIIVVFVAGVSSFFVSRMFFGKESDRNVEVKVVEVITTDFTPPSDQYFNENSVNPTQIITIGDNPEVPAEEPR